MKILLCCLAGVTSTLFSTKLKEAAARKGIDATVWSASEHAVEYSMDLADVVLVEPHVKDVVNKIKEKDPNKPVILITEEDFKNFNALKIFQMACDALNDK